MGGRKKVWFFIAFVLFGIVQSENSKASPKSSMLEDMLAFLKNGESQIVLSDANKDVVLMFGNTGAGKSTLTQWIATNSSQMFVTETGTGEFIIEDQANKISKNTVNSKTIYPDLFVDPETGIAFYDFSGFSDTRSTIHDIATSYFIKKVVDHVDRIKILLVVSHPSLRTGVNRLDFMELLKHTTELLKNVDKYVDGMALIATKVDGNYAWDKDLKQQVLIKDSVVIENIGTFLKEVKQNILERRSKTTVQSEEETFYRNAETILNGLLNKNGQVYSRIGIFRRPDRPGLLSESPLLETGKATIKHILANNTKFIAKNISDFGFTVSEKSKNDIAELVHEMENSIKKDVKNIQDELYVKCSALVDRLENLINKYDSKSPNFESDFAIIQQLTSELRLNYHDVKIFIEKIINLTPEDTISIILKNMTAASEINKNKLTQIETQEKILNFLRKVTGKQYTYDYDSLTAAFKGTLTYLEIKTSTLEKSVEQLDNRIDLLIKQNLTATVQLIKSGYQELEHNVKDIFALQDHLLHLNKKAKDAKDTNNPNELLKLINEMVYTNALSKFISNRFIILDQYHIFIRDELEPIAKFVLGKEEKQWFDYVSRLNDMQNSKDRFLELKRNFKDIFARRDHVFDSQKQKTDISNDIFEILKFINEISQIIALPQLIADQNKTLDKYFVFLKAELQPVEKFLENEKSWYDVMANFYDHLSSTNFQANINKKSCNDLLKVINRQCDGKKVADTNIAIHLKQCSKLLYHTQYDKIKDVTLNTVKIDSLFDIIDTNVNNQLLISCNLEQYKIRGTIIKTSEINDNFCRNITVRSVVIFALDKIVIDQDINMVGTNLQFSMIAPKWEIIGNKTISLEGITGKSIEPIKAPAEQNGFDGLPGKPGGNFLGIGEKFINGKGLSIFVNGGRGGNGQNGGDGANGKDGKIPELLTSLDNNYAIVTADWSKQKYAYEILPNDGNENSDVINYYVEGPKCTDGGIGGCGGIGGVGGKPGKAEVYGKSKFKITQEFGRPGRSGSGGKGGEPGRCGGAIKVRLRVHFNSSNQDKTSKIMSRECFPCKKGLSKGICKQERAQTDNLENPQRFVNKHILIDKYIAYLRENYCEFNKNLWDLFVHNLLKIIHKKSNK